MALATLADVENLLGGADTGDDTLIASLITLAESVVEGYVDRKLEDAVVTGELHDGPGHEILLLNRWPITTTSGVSVTEDGVALVNGTDFDAYQDGRVRRIASGGYGIPWTTKPASISVDYQGGYVTTGSGDTLLPAELTLVTARIAVRLYQAGDAYSEAPAGSAGIRQVTIAGSDSMSFGPAVATDVASAAGVLDAMDKAVLDKYRDLNL